MGQGSLDTSAVASNPAEEPTEEARLRTALLAADGIIAGLHREAQAASQAKTDFMARMTHEMRTPLSAIIGLSNLALDEERNPKLADYLVKIRASAKALLDVVDDITDFSRLEKGLADVVPVSGDLAATLDRVVDRFAEPARQKGLLLHTQIDAGVPSRLLADHVRLEQILGHLVGNAVKFTERGEVVLAVRELGRQDDGIRLEFSVRDTGIGMAQETIPAMLESFTQADGSLSRPYGGTGLGLAIVQRGVHLLGGELHAESAPGRGTLFSFAITVSGEDPAAALPAEAVAPGPAAAFGPTAGPPLAGAKILLVEDNTINQQVAREILERFGAGVAVARHGGEAVDMVRRVAYDVVLMDVQMPVMDGLTATRRIRARPDLAELPIVALTAHALAEDRDRCLAAGMNDYLTKPIDPEQMLATLGQWIAPASSAAGQRPTIRPDRPAAAPADRNAALDMATALARLGGNERLLHSVAAEFTRDYADCAADLRRLVADGDLEAAKRLAHTIKGVAGNIAANALAEAARTLEGRLGQGLRPTEPDLNAFARALERTLAATAGLAPAADTTPDAPARAAARWRILLVDDARFNRAIFTQILTDAGHDVVSAVNGKDACRLLFGGDAPTRPFDCILMDIEMPEMDGIRAAKLIRKLLAASINPPCAPDIPILAMTSHEPGAECDRCRLAGMDACLGKLFDRQELLTSLDHLLSQRQPFHRQGGRHAKADTARAAQPVLRRLADHLGEGNIQADEDVAELRNLLADAPPAELAALTEAVGRYDFAAALESLRRLTPALGVDPAAVFPD